MEHNLITKLLTIVIDNLDIIIKSNNRDEHVGNSCYISDINKLRGFSLHLCDEEKFLVFRGHSDEAQPYPCRMHGVLREWKIKYSELSGPNTILLDRIRILLHEYETNMCVKDYSTLFDKEDNATSDLSLLLS
jgi:hypothetical protein